jgi:hypothetical protein
MNKEELLLYYFDTDVSGNEIDGYRTHYVRKQEELITKNKRTEFIHVMDTLIPEWREDGMIQGKFSVTAVNYEQQLCICTQCIFNLCLLKHPTLPYSVQVGTVCVGKINPDLQREAEGLLRKKKKEMEEEKQCQRKKQWDDYNSLLFTLHARRNLSPCKDCGNYLVKKSESHYKPRCLDCYVKDKTAVTVPHKRLVHLF